MRVRTLIPENRRDVTAYVKLPFALYRDCPQWVPPLLDDMRRILDRRRHPYYRHSEAAHLMVESEGQPLGRLTVMDNRRYNDYNRSATAFFYYFECVDDDQAAQALFEAAFDWARRRGLTDVLGPWGMLRADAHGLLVEGFQHRPAMGQPYNHAYYVDLMAQAGLEKRIDYLSGYLQDYELPQRVTKLAERVKAQRGFRVKSFGSKQEMIAWAPKIQQINNASFTDVFGYYPMEDDDLQGAIKTLSAICEPDLVKTGAQGRRGGRIPDLLPRHQRGSAARPWSLVAYWLVAHLARPPHHPLDEHKRRSLAATVSGPGRLGHHVHRNAEKRLCAGPRQRRGGAGGGEQHQIAGRHARPKCTVVQAASSVQQGAVVSHGAKPPRWTGAALSGLETPADTAQGS